MYLIMIISDFFAMAASRPIALLRTKAAAEIPTVRSHPRIKTPRYSWRICKLREELLKTDQQMSVNAANSPMMVSPLTHTGAGARERSTKRLARDVTPAAYLSPFEPSTCSFSVLTNSCLRRRKRTRLFEGTFFQK